MTNYYRIHSGIYDASRWTFLYGRNRVVECLRIQPGERVLEIGCGTGKNFDMIQQCLLGAGELTGVDCSAPMLRRASEKVRTHGWKNVLLIDHEYGTESIRPGGFDVVLMSYSLSMIPHWETALACAQLELRPGGRIGVVDFCKPGESSKLFSDWLAVNHVRTDQPYEQRLLETFQKKTHLRYNAWAGLWSFYMFVGERSAYQQLEVA
jgi:S-adenosylmethionine-diacylgycerolhomoserine-N-methlytransferase